MIEKKILILGGSGTIGSYINYFLSQNRDNEIINVDIKKPKKIKNTNFIKFNLLNFKNYKSLEKKISKKFNKIDVLINCAAMVGTTKEKGWNEKFEKQSLSSWQRCIDTNLTSSFYSTQVLYNLLKKSQKPKIINFSSIYGFTAPRFEIYNKTKKNNQIAYSVSKAGIIQLTKWLSSYLDKKFSVNCVSFGGLSDSKMDKKFKRNYSKFTFKKRMMKIDDIRPVIEFLIETDYTTGQNLVIDGGWSTF